jgi:hypothetical protein
VLYARWGSNTKQEQAKMSREEQEAVDRIVAAIDNVAGCTKRNIPRSVEFASGTSGLRKLARLAMTLPSASEVFLTIAIMAIGTGASPTGWRGEHLGSGKFRVHTFRYHGARTANLPLRVEGADAWSGTPVSCWGVDPPVRGAGRCAF